MPETRDIKRLTDLELPDNTYSDGDILDAADLNSVVALLKSGINENFFDIKKVIAGTNDLIYVNSFTDLSEYTSSPEGTFAFTVGYTSTLGDLEDKAIYVYKRVNSSWGSADSPVYKLSLFQHAKDIGVLQADTGTLQTDVDTLQTDVDTLQTDVGTLQTDIVKKLDKTITDPQTIAGPITFNNTLTTSNVTMSGHVISWNPDWGTFDMTLLNDVTLQTGQELHFYGKAIEMINEGAVVEFYGAEGGHFLFRKARPSTINNNPELILGIATSSFSGNGVFGYITNYGLVNNINTTASPFNFQEGDELWFDSTLSDSYPGLLTNIKPTAPKAKVLVAACARRHQTQGSLFVRVTFYGKLSDLQDVSNEATDGQILEHNGTNWQPTSRLTTAEESIDGLLSTVSYLDENAVINTSTISGNTKIEGNRIDIASSSNNIYLTPAANDAVVVGNLHVEGNLVVDGQSIAVEFEELQTHQDQIILRSNAVSGLGSGFAGVVARVADGTNDAAMIFDGDGNARVGDYGWVGKSFTSGESVPTTHTSGIDYYIQTEATDPLFIWYYNGSSWVTLANQITYNAIAPEDPAINDVWMRPDFIKLFIWKGTNETQALATREDAPFDTGIPFWNATNKKFETNENILLNNSVSRITAPQVYATSTYHGINYQNPTNSLYSYLNLTDTGAIIGRNIGDGNTALRVNQANASATGNIVEFQKASSSLAWISQYGQIFASGLYNPSSANNGYVYMDNNGVQIARNVGDGNTALRINQANASSTGDIATFQWQGTSKATISRLGYVKAPVISNLNDILNSQVQLNDTGVAIYRDKADGNTPLIVNNANVSSTGNIASFQWQGSQELAITKRGELLHEGIRFLNFGGGTDTSNTILGKYAGGSINGTTNTGVGTNTFYSLTTGSNNTTIGYESSKLLVSGGQNTSVGHQALKNNTASDNTAVGYQASLGNTSGTYNIAIGKQALQSNQTGSYNNAIGVSALQNYVGTGNHNTAIGFSSAILTTTGDSNTAVGNYSLGDNTTGSNNTAIGYAALRFANGTQAVAVGQNAGRYSSYVLYNTWSSSTSYVVGDKVQYNDVGYNCILANTNQTPPNATYWTLLGSTKVLVANSSVFIGGSSRGATDSSSNEIVIGYNAVGNGSDTATLGNDSITKTILKGNVGIGTTDVRSKLHVYSDALNSVMIGNSGNDRKVLMLGYATGSSYASIQSIHTGVSYTPLALQLSGGSVGIGTSSPSSTLDVVGEIKGSAAIVSAATGGFAFYQSSAGATNYFSGKVGIGTNAPSSILHINAALPVLNIIDTGTAGSVIQFGKSGVALGKIAYNSTTADALQFYNGGTGSTYVRMSIMNDGKVGIGTTAPAGLFSVQLSTSSDYALVTNSDATSNNSAVLKVDANSSLANALRVQRDGKVGVGVSPALYALDVAGDVNITGSFKINGVTITGGGATPTQVLVANRSTQQGVTGTTPVKSQGITLNAGSYYQIEFYGMYSKAGAGVTFSPVITMAVNDVTGTPTWNGTFEWLALPSSTAYTIENNAVDLVTSTTAIGFQTSTPVTASIASTYFAVKGIIYTGTTVDKEVSIYVASSASATTCYIDKLSMKAVKVG